MTLIGHDFKPGFGLSFAAFQTEFCHIANIRLEPGKHELTAEEIAAAKADTAAIANGYGLCLVGVPGGRFRPLQSGQLCDARDPVKGFCPQPGCPDPA